MLKEAGVVDAGGAGFLLLLDSVLYVVDGSLCRSPSPTMERRERSAQRSTSVAATLGWRPAKLDVSEQRYEVMYFLDLPTTDRDFKEHWGAIGDSIVVVGGDGSGTATSTPTTIGAAIEVALDLGGRPKSIRVTDLFEEVDEEHANARPSSRHTRAGRVRVADGSAPR